MKPFLFLDYDGVIGDSINECFAVSWIAYYRIFRKKEPLTVSLDHYRRFRGLRPFIRSGEDFLAIHRMLDENYRVKDQEDFDAFLHVLGKEQMSQFRELFYEARNWLIQEDFTAWCALNPLYPHMKIFLSRYHKESGLYILSTKRREYIARILEVQGIPLPLERILYNGPREKFEIILDIIGPDRRALFVEDQVDHLLKCKDPRIEPFLASWGYIKPEWLGRGVRILEPKEVPGFWN